MKCDLNPPKNHQLLHFHIIFDSVTMAETMIIGAERKNKVRA